MTPEQFEPVAKKDRNGQWYWTLPESPLPDARPKRLRWGSREEWEAWVKSRDKFDDRQDWLDARPRPAVGSFMHAAVTGDYSMIDPKKLELAKRLGWKV